MLLEELNLLAGESAELRIGDMGALSLLESLQVPGHPISSLGCGHRVSTIIPILCYKPKCSPAPVHSFILGISAESLRQPADLFIYFFKKKVFPEAFPPLGPN